MRNDGHDSAQKDHSNTNGVFDSIPFETIDDTIDDSLEEFFALTSGRTSPKTLFPCPTKSNAQHSMSNQQRYYENAYPPLHNAIHLEIQENTRLPRLPIQVNRSNSAVNPSNATGYSPATHREIEEMMHLSNKDKSLSEAFLIDRNRSNADRVYKVAGLLKDHEEKHHHSAEEINRKKYILSDIPEKVENSGENNAYKKQQKSNSTDLENIVASVEPTPLEEIKRKSRKRPIEDSFLDSEPVVEFVPMTAGGTQFHNSYYPYARSYPLPIPTKPSSPIMVASAPSSPNVASISQKKQAKTTNNVSLAAAISTAAAIVCNQSTHGPGDAQKLSTCTTPIPPLSTPGPYTTAQQKNQKSHQYSGSRSIIKTSTMKTTNATVTSRAQAPAIPFKPASQYVRLGGPTNPPQHSSNHTTPSGAMINATQQKTRYGFGGNHVVPSVPHPPPKDIKSNKKTLSLNAPIENQKETPIVMMQHGQQSPPSSGGQNNSVDTAYERKKQKAKNARVKLNESIESLGIAMNMAGTQSTQRAIQLNYLPPSSYRTTCLQVMKECTGIAESAKKWDRPNFVGTAAKLVQSLNAQCEVLMKEILELQQSKSTAAKSNASITTKNVCESNASLGRKRITPISRALDANGTVAGSITKKDNPPINSNKRNSIGALEKPIYIINESENNDELIQKEPNGFNSSKSNILFGTHLGGKAMEVNKSLWEPIASFLDPISLIRCGEVSKYWREKGFFSKEEVWLRLCAERFGFISIRQWKEKLEDGEKCNSATKLYKSMDFANVVPHFQREKLISLGETRMSGRVSAWAFLVRRSNGETLRTVKRDASDIINHRRNCMYISLPVIELRTIIQNTGAVNGPIILKEQLQTVDASTRRRGEELKEIDWDDRFKKRILNLDGSEHSHRSNEQLGIETCTELCRLRLFDAVILVTYIHARGCSTTTKFIQRGNFTKVLVCINNTTFPLVIPFPQDASHVLFDC